MQAIFQATRGNLMVVDLQGIISKAISTGEPTVFLTDPAIHCKDRTRFGRTNLGERGFKEFFSTHECNIYCQVLEITDYKHGPSSSPSTSRT